jgi:hypothetical protein
VGLFFFSVEKETGQSAHFFGSLIKNKIQCAVVRLVECQGKVAPLWYDSITASTADYSPR